MFLLTSSRTFSAVEEFAFNLQTRQRARLIGETTGGGANPGRSHPLPGGFSVFVSNGRAVNPVTGTNWEGVGVEPDIAMPQEQALRRLQAQGVSHPAVLAALGATLHLHADDACVGLVALGVGEDGLVGLGGLVGAVVDDLALGGLAGALGLDELSVRGESLNADGSTRAAAVTLGKRISNELYLSYETGLAGAMGTVSVFYDLSRRFTLRARAGEENAVDLIFTLHYD